MGLIKQEFTGGAQAVTDGQQVAAFPNQDVAGCFGNAQPSGTSFSAFASNANDALYDAAVSNHVEDAEINEIIRKQEQQVFEATLRLNFLEDRHKATKSTDSGNAVSPGSATNNAATSESLTRKIAKNIGEIPLPEIKDPVKLPFEKILKLLLASIKGSFAENIPRQKCASPVPYNSANEGYHPMFYVSKERKLTKTEDTFEGIPVRYQGFTKSTVWYSPENPRWGIVARRMQHQSRMKQKASNEEDMASKAALFFHIFKGFSYVLIERTNPNEEINKSKLASYVVENAAKFVQVWPIVKPSTAGANNKLANPPLKLTKPAPSISKASAATAGGAVRLPPARPSLSHPKSLSAVATKKRSFDAVIKGTASERETLGFFERESKRHHSSDDMFGLAFTGSSGPAQDDFDLFGPVRSESTLCTSAIDNISHSGSSVHSHHSVSSLPHRLSHHSLSSSSSSSSSSNVRPDLTSSVDCEILLEEALLSGEEDYESRGSDETTLQDIFIEESDDGFGGSHDPLGVVLADNIFKTFCDSMHISEFAREYERIQTLLFDKRFSQGLRMALDNKDPRLQQNFLFPQFGSPDAHFSPNAPVGSLRMMERNVGSGDFIVDSCDEKAKDILRMDPLGTPSLFETLDKSDMTYIMAKFFLLQLGKPSSYWFQRIVTTAGGRPAVVRGYAFVSGCPSTGRQSWSIQFQDVSFLFSELLTLPAADIFAA